MILAHCLLGSRQAAAEGVSDETQLPTHRNWRGKVQKGEKSLQGSYHGQYVAAIYGIAAPPRADIRGGIRAEHPVNSMRQKLAQPVYLAAIGIAMVGWMWMLFQGIEWAFGV